MPDKPKILAFAGSLRKDSCNKKLVKIASMSARNEGFEVNYIDFADYLLPLYDGDLEEREGLPQPVKELKKLFLDHQGFLISSPEYNSSISGTFKNIIDWISRPAENEPYYLAPFKGKAAAIMSASPGALGGLRGLVHLRAMLENVSVYVYPEQMTIPYAYEAFNPEGQLKDQKQQEKVVRFAKDFTHFLAKLEQPIQEKSLL